MMLSPKLPATLASVHRHLDGVVWRDVQQSNAAIARIMRLLAQTNLAGRADHLPGIEEWCEARNRGFSNINAFLPAEWVEMLTLDLYKTLFLLSCAAMNGNIAQTELAKGVDVMWSQAGVWWAAMELHNPRVVAWLRKQWWHQQAVDILWHSLPSPARDTLQQLSNYDLRDTVPFALDPANVVVVDCIHDLANQTVSRDIIGFQLEQFVELYCPAAQVVTMAELRKAVGQQPNHPLARRQLVIFGAHTLDLLPAARWVLPPGSVLFNYEILSEASSWWNNPVYRWMLQRLPVLDFSHCNAAFLRTRANNARVAVLCPRPTPCMLAKTATAKDKQPPVYFVGSTNTRRQLWLEDVSRSCAVPITRLMNLKPRAMVACLPANAVVLNVHYNEDAPHLETVRLLHLMMNGVVVLSEQAVRDPAAQIYERAGVPFFETSQQMADRLAQLLQNPVLLESTRKQQKDGVNTYVNEFFAQQAKEVITTTKK